MAIRIGPLAVHWYALTYLAAFVVGYILMRRRLRMEPYRSITRPKPWDKTDVEDTLLFAIMGVLIGGRLGYVVFYRPGQYFADPVSILYVWQGGMSFHGGLIGLVIGLVVFALRRGRPFLQVTDLLAPAVGIGLFFGRIGNFINGELWGRPAPEWLPWAMRFPTGGDVLRHPSQIYQALLEGLTLFLVLLWYARKPRFRGQVSGAFLFGYGALRFVAEYFREPDDFLGLLGLGLSLGQWLCVPMIVGGAAIWFWAGKRALSDVEESAGEEDDPEPAESGEVTEPEDKEQPPASKQQASHEATEIRPEVADDDVVDGDSPNVAKVDGAEDLIPDPSRFIPAPGEVASVVTPDEVRPRRAADPR